MTKEFWAIIGVGVVLLGVIGGTSFSLRSDIAALRGDVANVRERLSALEATVGLIVQGLHIEIQGGSGSDD